MIEERQRQYVRDVALTYGANAPSWWPELLLDSEQPTDDVDHDEHVRYEDTQPYRAQT